MKCLASHLHNMPKDWGRKSRKGKGGGEQQIKIWKKMGVGGVGRGHLHHTPSIFYSTYIFLVVVFFWLCFILLSLFYSAFLFSFVKTGLLLIQILYFFCLFLPAQRCPAQLTVIVPCGMDKRLLNWIEKDTLYHKMLKASMHLNCHIYLQQVIMLANYWACFSF